MGLGQHEKSALHMAVEGGHDAVAAYLMVNNADVNAAEEVCAEAGHWVDGGGCRVEVAQRYTWRLQEATTR